MALWDTEGRTFSPSFRLLEEVQGINIIFLVCAGEIQLQLFSLTEYRDGQGASAGSCLSLIERKPPKQARAVLGKWRLMRPHGAGARPEQGSLHTHFYKQLAPSQQLMGWEWCSCTESFPEKKKKENTKHFQLQTYLSLSCRVCYVSVSELKRQGGGEYFWLGIFHRKTF